MSKNHNTLICFLQKIRPADEVEAAFRADKKKALADRKLFVSNLIWLLMQTREGIRGGYLDDHDIVHVLYDNESAEQKINVNADSYFAIIKDVVTNLD